MLKDKLKFNLQLFSDGEPGEQSVNDNGIADQPGTDGENNETGTEHEEPEAEGEEVQEEVEEDNTEGDGDYSHIDNSKAFAKRLSAKTSQIEAQYRPAMSLVEKMAAKYNMTAEEYIAAVQADMEEEEREAEKEKYQGLNEEEIAALKWAKENKPKMEQQEKWNNEARALVEKFPEVKKVEDIPQEAIDLNVKYGVPLVEGYAMVKGKASTQTREEAEQAAIRKIKTGASSSPGALGVDGGQPSKKSFNEMSSKEFKEYVEKVKRGEIRE